MSWILIAILGYFFLAIAAVNDKIFLGNVVRDSRVYTLFVGILGGLVLVLMPFGFYIPSLVQIGLNLATGALFIVALWTLFRSLKLGDASLVIPALGGGVPIVILLLSWMFLGDALGNRELIAFVFLIIGGVALTTETSSQRLLFRGPFILSLLGALLAGGASFVLSKYIYDTQGFISGFIWIRLGSLATALVLLLRRDLRDVCAETLHALTSKKKAYFVANQAAGATGFTLQSFAIALGNVALVNALQGVEYVFVIALVVLLSRKYPHLLQEKITKRMMMEKGIAVGLVCVGLAVLAAA